MTIPTVLATTWDDGLFVVSGQDRKHEFAGRTLRGLTRDQAGDALAIVDGHLLCRRSADGNWGTVAGSEWELSCCLAVNDEIYVGTDDARVLRLGPKGVFNQVPGFDTVAGRDSWYAGSAVINGQVVGPPLGIRSIAATSDGIVLLANVHVGGIPRSTDGGVSWSPTIDIDCDVHEVCSHPTDPRLLIAAAAVGFCVSRDAGATWKVERAGLHATYCSAVAFCGEDMLVSASADHFSSQGAIYRRPINDNGPLLRVADGLPRWLEGIADTHCLVASDSAVAVADRGGNLYLSSDAGAWTRYADGPANVSSVLIV